MRSEGTTAWAATDPQRFWALSAMCRTRDGSIRFGLLIVPDILFPTLSLAIMLVLEWIVLTKIWDR